MLGSWNGLGHTEETKIKSKCELFLRFVFDHGFVKSCSEISDFD